MKTLDPVQTAAVHLAMEADLYLRTYNVRVRDLMDDLLDDIEEALS